MKEILELINIHLKDKCLDNFRIENFSKNENSIQVIFETVSGGEFENTTLFLEFSDVDYISLPKSYNTSSVFNLNEVTNEFKIVFDKLGVSYSDICDIDKSGGLIGHLICMDTSTSKFYVMCSDLNSWIENYPDKTKINL